MVALAGLLIDVHGQSDAGEVARRFRRSHEKEILTEFYELLSIPNVASDTINIRRNASLITKLLERRGVKTQLLEIKDAPPVVYGELLTPGATRTMVFYAHYDGQPVEPAKWLGEQPFKPVLRSFSPGGSRDIEFPATGTSFDPE